MSGYPYARGSFYPSVPPVPSTTYIQPRPVNPPPPAYNPSLPAGFSRQGFYPPSTPYVTPNPPIRPVPKPAVETVQEPRSIKPKTNLNISVSFNSEYLLPNVNPSSEIKTYGNDNLCELIMATNQIAEECKSCI